MPRVATASISRALKSSRSGKTPPNPPLPFLCPEPGCPWSYPRAYDLRRHRNCHLSPEEKNKKMFHCDVTGCTYKALQKSNLETHRNAKHLGRKPHACSRCSYRTADPSCLNKHMRYVHCQPANGATRKRRVVSKASLFLEPPSSEWTPASSPSGSFESPDPSESSFSSTSDHSSLLAVDDFSLDYIPAYYPLSPSSSSSDLSSSWELDLETTCLGMQASVPATGPHGAPSPLYPAEHMAFPPGCPNVPFLPSHGQSQDPVTSDFRFDELLAMTESPPPVLEYLPPSAAALQLPPSESPPPVFDYPPPSALPLPPSESYYYPYTYVYTTPQFQREWKGVVY